MKKIFIAAFFSIVTATASASTYVFNATGPYFDSYITGNVGFPGLCIGGEICGRDSSIIINYPYGTYFGNLVVSAHDNIGDRTDAMLQLYVNGILSGEADVKKAGSTISFPINKFVNSIQLKSININRGPGGDETQVMTFRTF